MAEIKKVSYKEASENNWSVSVTTENPFPGREVVQLGCLQRIATATEAMAKNHLELQAQLKRMTESRDSWRRWHDSEKNKVKAYKGVITKLKKKIAANGHTGSN